MTTTLRVQPGQSGQGMDYNVALPLPYPWFVDVSTGEVAHPEVHGTDRLVGFQRDESPPTDFSADFIHLDAAAKDPGSVVGWRPVWTDGNGGMYALTVQVTSCEVVE